MMAWKRDQTGAARQLRQGALRALRVLETCPLVPVHAFVHLAGLRDQSSAYQQLARLRHAGLAEARRIDPGYLVGERRLSCWTITDKGTRMLGLATGPCEQEPFPQTRRGSRGPHRRVPISHCDLPLLIATYRLLASLVLERGARGHVIAVTTFEWPWVREWRSVTDDKLLRVRMPAGAILSASEEDLDSDRVGEQLTQVLLVPDLGSAPVARYREMLRRLVAYREEATFDDVLADNEPEVVIATPNPDGTAARSNAWLELLDRIERRHGEYSLQVRVLTWEWVTNMVMPARSQDVCCGDEHRSPRGESGQLDLLHRSAPARSHEQLLHLIGRHPCLTVDHLAGLLGTNVHRIRGLESDLIEDGLLRRIEFDELPRGTDLAYKDFAALGLVEITSKGRRRLAGWLGLEQAAATRYHGFIGNSRRDGGRRWRLLRALFHSLGANSVFVAFAVAADAVRRAGGSDQLVEWRGASACERNYCKPDGYGCYVRNGLSYGFFLEFDRGTERGRHYAAKVHAYYGYRDSGQAARDYSGFPTVLFVTTHPIAEQRMADWSYRAAFIRGTEPLAIMTTTMDLISRNPQGILGPIWGTGPGSESRLPRQYWLPGRLPRDFSNVHVSAAPSQLGRWW